MKRTPCAPDLVKELLPCGVIIMISNRISAEYGLPEAPKGAIRRMYDEDGLPLVYENENGRLWVDKYYVAYNLCDEGIRYAYLTHHHIKEEYSGYAAAAKARKEPTHLPVEIMKEFNRAAVAMFLKGRRCWAEKRFLENPLSRQK